jgi:MYXO-CTERM domain-containing protein
MTVGVMWRLLPRNAVSARAVALGVGAALLLASAGAEAFCRSTTCSGECARSEDNCKMEGVKLYWPTQCVGFSLDRGGSEHIPLDVIRKVTAVSLAQWSALECPGGGSATFAYTQLKDVDCHKAEFNPDGPNANIILFQDHKWQYTSADNTLAKTTVSYDTDSGEIFDADIEMNHAYNEFTTGDDYVVYDVQSILTHEIGHALGLDHTPDFSATMNASYQDGTVDLRTIEEDDMAAVCDAYPPGRSAKCDPEPRGGFTRLCAGDAEELEEEGCSMGPRPRRAPGPPAPLALLALAALVAARRRR